jgi:hypothetical protein
MPSICRRMNLSSQYRFSDILFPPLGGLPGLSRLGPTEMTCCLIWLSGIRNEDRSSPDACSSAVTISWNCATASSSNDVGGYFRNALKTRPGTGPLSGIVHQEHDNKHLH